MLLKGCLNVTAKHTKVSLHKLTYTHFLAQYVIDNTLIILILLIYASSKDLTKEINGLVTRKATG